MSRSRILRISLALLAVIALSATSSAKPPAKVAMVLLTGLGDRSFCDSAYAGLVRAQKEFGISAKVLECKADPSRYYDQLLAAAETSDLVFAVPGYQMDRELEELAPQFPKTTFVYVDGTGALPQLVYLNFAEHEGSFLAGALAALMTKTKVIGMVGYFDVPVIRNFLVGFRQGAATVDPSVKTEVLYVGVLDDVAKAKELTFALHNKGADIVYQVAGRAGEGVFLASKEAKRYAIGVDSDQCSIAPDNIICSMTKRLDNAVYQTIKSMLSGDLARGKTYTYGLKEKGVGLCYCDVMRKHVPKAAVDRLQSLENQIVAGQIKVEKGK